MAMGDGAMGSGATGYDDDDDDDDDGDGRRRRRRRRWRRRDDDDDDGDGATARRDTKTTAMTKSDGGKQRNNQPKNGGLCAATTAADVALSRCRDRCCHRAAAIRCAPPLRFALPPPQPRSIQAAADVALSNCVGLPVLTFRLYQFQQVSAQ